MAEIGPALLALLAADSDVAAVLVSGGKTRIFPTIVPEEAALPYIRYQVVSDPRPEHLRGYQGSRVTRVQVDCFALKYLDARDLAQKVITATSGAGAIFAGIRFGRIKAEGPRDLGEDVTGIGFVHRASVDLLAEHTLV